MLNLMFLEKLVLKRMLILGLRLFLMVRTSLTYWGFWLQLILACV